MHQVLGKNNSYMKDLERFIYYLNKAKDPPQLRKKKKKTYRVGCIARNCDNDAKAIGKKQTVLVSFLFHLLCLFF